MKFSTSSVVLSLLVALSSAAPVASQAKRALTAQSYSQFQVSDGVAGNALAEVNAKFPVRVDPENQDDAERGQLRERGRGERTVLRSPPPPL